MGQDDDRPTDDATARPERPWKLDRRRLLGTVTGLALLPLGDGAAEATAAQPLRGEPWDDGTFWDDGTGWVD